ncbi:MAG: ATP-binding cassette domain-containing protein, partial [Actinobacteria bacterium]|nr:ATP-binding cassette domain-containing protein [Actinomycetota bacterium]
MEHAALTGINFEVAAGKFFTLIGPSGCGKTTLLRIVAGLTSPSEGRILIDGQPSLGPSREKSLVFQHFNLFPWRTALENVAYGLEMQRVHKRERLEKAGEYLKLVNLDGFADHYPHELSGGMR